MKIIKLISGLFLLILLFVEGLYSQDRLCKTKDTIPDYLLENGIDPSKSTLDQVIVRVYIHKVTRSDGEGGVADDQIINAMNILSGDFRPSIMFRFESVDVIESTTLYQNPSTDLFTRNPHEDGIDVYLLPAGAVYGNDGFGDAGNVPSKHFFVAGNFWEEPYLELISMSVLSHEMGYCLGLRHTDVGGLNSGEAGTRELITRGDGANCQIAGDLICDTPADPDINYEVDINNNCNYIGNVHEPETGLLYEPDTKNIMAHTCPCCMSLFTDWQFSRMLSNIENNPLLSGITIEPSDLNVDIDQQSALLNSIDSIGIWRTVQSDDAIIHYFEMRKVPLTYHLAEDEFQLTLSASKKIIDGEEFMLWKSEIDKILGDKLISEFGKSSLGNGAIAKFNSFANSKVYCGGEVDTLELKVKMKNPWLRDYQWSSSWINNRGSDAIWHEYSTPYNITLEGEHQGVFLNQGYNDPDKPYYSVKAVSPQEIDVNGRIHKFYFQRWEAV